MAAFSSGGRSEPDGPEALLGEASERSSPIGPSVSACLAHWLPSTDTNGDGMGTGELTTVSPQNADEELRGLVLMIDSIKPVGTLLDQALRDLSAEQARGSNYFTPGDMARLIVGAAAPQDGHRVLDSVRGSAEAPGRSLHVPCRV
jgi:type I restriction enzyme M protein